MLSVVITILAPTPCDSPPDACLPPAFLRVEGWSEEGEKKNGAEQLCSSRGGVWVRRAQGSPLSTGFTSSAGDEQCAASAAASSSFTGVTLWTGSISASSGSSLTTAGHSSGGGWLAPCVLVACALLGWPHGLLGMASGQAAARLGGVLGFFWKKLLITELPPLLLPPPPPLLLCSCCRGVLHLTAEPGVLGEIGGESKVAFDSCCLQVGETSECLYSQT